MSPGRLAGIQQAVFVSKYGRLHPVGGPDLLVDVGRVPPGRAFGDDQLLGYLHIGLADGDEAQDFDLSFSEAAGIGGGRFG